MRKFTLSVLVLIVSVFFTFGQKSDNFDSYTAGQLLCPQSGGFWTTWDNNPGGDYDGYVVDDMSSSSPNSLGVDAAVIESDIVTDLGQTTTGIWEVSLDIYVPDGGYGGYFNVMQDMEIWGAANEWGFQIYFRSDGTGYFYDADFNQTDFTYNVAEWNHIALVVDLDMDMASLYIDGAMVGASWQWDVAGPNMLGAIDIYAAADGNDDPMFYIDNFSFAAPGGGDNCDDFDSYVAGELLCPQSGGFWTTWDDNPGGDYDGYVVDDMASSSPNSLGVDAAVIESDIVTNLGQTTAGVWEVSLDIYIPDGGFGGYFNVMQDMEIWGAANEWGFQIYFRSDGTGYYYDADFNQTDFTYNVAEWNHIALVVDLDMAMAELYIDGAMAGAAWQWDVAGPNMLGAVDIYAAADGNDDPKFYIDNFCFAEYVPGGNCDDFDSYVAGELLCPQSGGFWTTWDDNPGGDYDGYVVDDMALSAPNSLGVDAAVIESDLVTNLGQTTAGIWEVSLDIYIPDGGFGGYFNVMQDMEIWGAANEWGFQIYFRSDGTGYFYDADFNQTDFTYNVAEWNHIALVVDLDMAMASLYIDGAMVGASWQWDVAGPNMLGAVDIYAAADGNDDPKFYIDNFCFTEMEPSGDCDFFDTYVAGDFLCTQSDLWTTWDDNPGGDYDGYVVDDMSYSAPNSFGIDAAVIETDAVYDLGQMTTGKHYISLMMYVPDGGFGGYYNVMQDMELFGSANEWGFQVYFRSDGTGYFYDADFNQTDFTYNVGEWNECILYVDLDADIAQYVINDDILGTWQWSVAGPLMLGAVDVYAAADGNDDPKFYIDNFCYGVTDIMIGIEDPVVNTSIETAIFPNPAKDHVTIEANGIIDQILIYNNMGQLVFSGEVNDDQIMVNTSTFITGMYIVQIKSGENVEVRKLIIE